MQSPPCIPPLHCNTAPAWPQVRGCTTIFPCFPLPTIGDWQKNTFILDLSTYSTYGSERQDHTLLSFIKKEQNSLCTIYAHLLSSTFDEIHRKYAFLLCYSLIPKSKVSFTQIWDSGFMIQFKKRPKGKSLTT